MWGVKKMEKKTTKREGGGEGGGRVWGFLGLQMFALALHLLVANKPALKFKGYFSYDEMHLNGSHVYDSKFIFLSFLIEIK